MTLIGETASRFDTALSEIENCVGIAKRYRTLFRGFPHSQEVTKALETLTALNNRLIEVANAIDEVLDATQGDDERLAAEDCL